jgi:hypothetical protein
MWTNAKTVVSLSDDSTVNDILTMSINMGEQKNLKSLRPKILHSELFFKWLLVGWVVLEHWLGHHHAQHCK